MMKRRLLFLPALATLLAAPFLLGAGGVTFPPLPVPVCAGSVFPASGNPGAGTCPNCASSAMINNGSCGAATTPGAGNQCTMKTVQYTYQTYDNLCTNGGYCRIKNNISSTYIDVVSGAAC